jgi:hypothetical protein
MKEIVISKMTVSCVLCWLVPFAPWTVPARIGVFVAFVGFVVAGLVGPVMIALGSVDLLGALWTRWTLKAEG